MFKSNIFMQDYTPGKELIIVFNSVLQSSCISHHWSLLPL